MAYMMGKKRRQLARIACHVCGKTFKPYVDYARYCGKKCRNRAHIEAYFRRRLGMDHA